jgi:tRNA(adenine34) deaminase
VESGRGFSLKATCHHAPEVYSAVGKIEAAGLLREFFRATR